MPLPESEEAFRDEMYDAFIDYLGSTPLRDADKRAADRMGNIMNYSPTNHYIDYRGKVGYKTLDTFAEAFDVRVSGVMDSPRDDADNRIWFRPMDESAVEHTVDTHVCEHAVDALAKGELSEAEKDAIIELLQADGHNVRETTQYLLDE